MTDLPGVRGRYQAPSGGMSRDLAARRIQSAYRVHLNKRRVVVGRKKPSQVVTTTRSSKSQPPPPPLQLKSLLMPKTDEYNFINVYKKKKKVGLNLNDDETSKRPSASRKSPTRRAASKQSDFQFRQVVVIILDFLLN